MLQSIVWRPCADPTYGFHGCCIVLKGTDRQPGAVCTRRQCPPGFLLVFRGLGMRDETVHAVLGMASCPFQCQGMPSPSCPSALAHLHHPETQLVGFGKQARGGWGGGGFLGACQAVLGSFLLLARKQPFPHLPPWRSTKHPFPFGCFQRQQQKLLRVKQNCAPKGPEVEDEHLWVTAGSR